MQDPDYHATIAKVRTLEIDTEDEKGLIDYLENIRIQHPSAIIVPSSLPQAAEGLQQKLGTNYEIVVLEYDANVLTESDHTPPEAKQSFCVVGRRGGVVFIPMNSLANVEVSLAHELGHIHLHITALEKGELENFQKKSILEIEKAVDGVVLQLCGFHKTEGWLKTLLPYRDREHFSERILTLTTS